ncbi:MAG: type II secretion system protein N [Candidatus Babeliales bacterium]
MKHPFWLLNSTLLLTFIGSILFVIFSWQKMPLKVSFEPGPEIKPIKKELTKIDLSKIYTNDLFDTYVQPLPSIKQPTFTAPIPAPPIPKPPAIPSTPPIKFLEPLKINLRGIIIASDERMNIAIIQDAKTGKSENYKIGDMLEDAQLIRILKNKIILIRSNGQQETLYVSQHDAELEQLMKPQQNWTSVIKKTSENVYSIDTDLFAEKIKNLSQFIDALNLTTVYKQGESIGCRLGKQSNDSLGLALGLMQGDIIESIQGIPVTTTENRFTIYQNLLSLEKGQEISVIVIRRGQPMRFSYLLEKYTGISAAAQLEGISVKYDEKTEEQVKAEKRKLLEEKYRFAPTAEELQKKEKQDMLKLSRRNSQLSNRQNRSTLLNTMKL